MQNFSRSIQPKPGMTIRIEKMMLNRMKAQIVTTGMPKLQIQPIPQARPVSFGSSPTL